MSNIWEILCTVLGFIACGLVVLLYRRFVIAHRLLRLSEQSLRKELRQEIVLIGQNSGKDMQICVNGLQKGLAESNEAAEQRTKLLQRDLAQLLENIKLEHVESVQALKAHLDRLESQRAADKQQQDVALKDLMVQLKESRVLADNGLAQLSKKMTQQALVEKFTLLMSARKDEQIRPLVAGIRLLADEGLFAEMTVAFPSRPLPNCATSPLKADSARPCTSLLYPSSICSLRRVITMRRITGSGNHGGSES